MQLAMVKLIPPPRGVQHFPSRPRRVQRHGGRHFSAATPPGASERCGATGDQFLGGQQGWPYPKGTTAMGETEGPSQNELFISLFICFLLGKTSRVMDFAPLLVLPDHLCPHRCRPVLPCGATHETHRITLLLLLFQL